MKRYWMILCLLLVASAKSFGMSEVYKELIEYWKYRLAEGEKLEDKDPYYNKITQLKSVQSLPDGFTFSCKMEDLGGSIKIEFPILTKAQEKEKGLTNKDLDKTADTLKKDISKVLSKAQDKWKETKDKKAGKFILECTFTDKGTYSKLLASEKKAFESNGAKKMAEIEAKIETEKKRILKEVEDYEKQVAAWKEFLQKPYYFDFNQKLSGQVFEKLDERGTMTFLSETEVKIELLSGFYNEKSFKIYEITGRDTGGLTIVPKNGGDEARIDFYTNNLADAGTPFGHETGTYIKKGYKRPALNIKGKSVSRTPRVISFLKSYGLENIPYALTPTDSYSKEPVVLKEYIFQKDGKLKILNYEYKGRNINKDNLDWYSNNSITMKYYELSETSNYYLDRYKTAYNIDGICRYGDGFLIKKAQKDDASFGIVGEEFKHDPLIKPESYSIKTIQDLKNIISIFKANEKFLDTLSKMHYLPFYENGSYAVTEDEDSEKYTWKIDDKGNIICSNPCSSEPYLTLWTRTRFDGVPIYHEYAFGQFLLVK